jgi:hypothetical protein
MRECFLQSKMTKISESKVQVLLHTFLQGKPIATQALKSITKPRSEGHIHFDKMDSMKGTVATHVMR